MTEQTLARNGFLAFTIPIAAIGFSLFMVGILLMLYEKGKLMSDRRLENCMASRRTCDLGHRFCVKIGLCGKSYAMCCETEFVQKLIRAGSRCRFSPHTIVEHLIDERHLNKSWVLRRAVFFGRGCMRLDFFESPWSDETWPDLKRDLLGRTWQCTWQAFCAAMAGDQERLFRNRWELSFW